MGVAFGPTGADYTGTKRDIVLCQNGIGYASTEGSLYDDGETNGNDSVDDMQGAHASWFTGANRSNCNETNFSDVSNLIVPDDTKREASSTILDADSDGNPNTGPGSIPWTKVFQDNLTGLYFSNVLAADDGTTDMTWSQALDFCVGLDGGTAGSGWRLPTQKELMQLYVNGISRISSFGDTSQKHWSSSSRSWSSTSEAWSTSLANGWTYHMGKVGARAVLCVRE